MQLPAEINVKLIGNEGAKQEVRLQWPSDAQWTARQRARKTIIRQLGGGKSETEVSGGEDADLDLFRAIRLDESKDLDKYEAQLVVNRLATCEIRGVRRDAPGFVVEAETAAGLLEFQMSIPSAAQRAQHGRNFVRLIDLPYNQQEVKVNLGAAGELFDALCSERAIPLPWKVSIVSALLTALNQEVGGDEDFLS